jgi:hypothetical protein
VCESIYDNAAFLLLGRAQGHSHAWEGRPRAALPRGQALRLAQAAGIGGRRPLTAGVAALLEGTQQPPRRRAPRMPAFEEIGLLWGEQTVPAVAAVFAPGKRRRAAIVLHGAGTQADVVRNRGACPPWARQRPDLGMQRLPACWALGRTLLGGCWDVWRQHEHRARPIGRRHGLRAS